jgi:hypothetical protein
MSGPSGQDRVTRAQILAAAARGLEVYFFFKDPSERHAAGGQDLRFIYQLKTYGSELRE